MPVIITDTQQVRLTLDIRNKKGNPAPVDGVPQWAISDPNVASVEPDADGMSAIVKANVTGTTQVTATVDADRGEGVRTLAVTDSVQVLAGEAVTVGFVAGTPEEQPTA
jgi:hypothetical protein